MADLPFKPFNSSGTFLYTRVFSSTLIVKRDSMRRDSISIRWRTPPTYFGIPRVEVEGLPIGGRIRFGAARRRGTPGIFAQNIFEFSDTLSKTIKPHA